MARFRLRFGRLAHAPAMTPEKDAGLPKTRPQERVPSGAVLIDPAPCNGCPPSRSRCGVGKSDQPTGSPATTVDFAAARELAAQLNGAL